MRWWKRRKA